MALLALPPEPSDHSIDTLPRDPKMTYPDDPSFGSPNQDARLELPQEEIDAIIRNKRKARDPKACYACHRRKVKCDRNLPCDSCVKRDHPELCSYERPGKKRRIALAGNVGKLDPSGNENGSDHPPQQSGEEVTIPKVQWDRMNKELQTLREWVRRAHVQVEDEHIDSNLDQDDADEATHGASDESEREGIQAQSNQIGTMHLGSRSVLAYMVALGRSKSSQDAAINLLEENILPKLGLDNETATYPFVDLWSTDNSIQDVSGLCRALPDDTQCREFFAAYRDVACTIYPVIADAGAFENNLNFLLANRARIGENTHLIDRDRPYGVSISWLALLFAVLASGAQCTSRLAKERELTSQVYTCCSYHALRMANFLTHPSLNAIQAFLIIGNVLSYNMNPGVSYIFLGLTMRMAFSIGLQADPHRFPASEQYLRGRIWWALAWQDSHFAVSYDRPTSSVFCTPPIPYRKSSTPGHRSYAESMFRIIKLTQEIIRERVLNPRTTMTWATIQAYKDEVARIVSDGGPYLRDRSKCQYLTQHLERLALKLHSSYITSELCRPALNQPAISPNYDTPRSSSATPAHSPHPGGNARRKSSHASTRSPTTSTISPDASLPAQLRRECVVNLQNTIESFVELHSLSECAARSWIGLQRAISAAFLLGTLPDIHQDPRMHTLLRDLERVISQRTVEDPAFTELSTTGPGSPQRARRTSSADQVPLAESPHWARSMAKSLQALGKMNKALNAGAGMSQCHGAETVGVNVIQPRPENQNFVPPRQVPQSSPTYSHPTGAGQIHSLGPPTSSPLTAGPGAMVKNGTAGPVSIAGGLAMPTASTVAASAPHANAPFPNLKSETFSPAAGLSAITPDSTSSSSEWNYGNMTERALEFVSPALWG